MTTRFLTKPVGLLVLAIALSLSALVIISRALMSVRAAPLQSIITVNPDDSIQAAIDAANPGDTIVINAGTYTESLTLNKAVSLTGVSSTTVVLRALPNQRVITITGSSVDQSVIISGFTATGGNLTGGVVCPDYCGGGLLITGSAQPQVRGLVLSSNYAQESRGGLYTDSPLTINQILLISNSVRHAGGGAFFKEAAEVNFGQFEGNTCVAAVAADCTGGGLFAGKTLILNNSEFTSNTVSSGGVFGSGGGIAASQAVTIVNTNFKENKCQDNFCNGGGLYAFRTLVATDTAFIGNMATQSSGGVYGGIVGSSLFNVRFVENYCTGISCWGGGLASDGVVTVTRSVFIGNSTMAGSPGGALTFSQGRIVNSLFLYHSGIGAALYVPHSGGIVEVLHSTIAVGSGQAIQTEGGSTFITNTIVSSYTTGLYQNGSAVIYEDHNLYFDNGVDFGGTIVTGTHDVFGDPHFSDPANDDYHIVSPSAAIDVGINAGVTTDLDGFPRPIGLGYDIGAYEYVNWTNHVYLP